MIETVKNQRTDNCVKYFSELILDELATVISENPIPGNLITVLAAKSDVWVAGGSVRAWFASERIYDIDLFFSDEAIREVALKHLLANGGELVYQNGNVDKVKYNDRIFDFCKKYYDDAEKCIAEFDYTVSQAAVTVEDFVCDDRFFMDLASKRLAFNKITYSASTLYRFQKYARRGYWMCKGEMVKLIKALRMEETDFSEENAEQTIEDHSDTNTNPFPGID